MEELRRSIIEFAYHISCLKESGSAKGVENSLTIIPYEDWKDSMITTYKSSFLIT